MFFCPPQDSSEVGLNVMALPAGGGEGAAEDSASTGGRGGGVGPPISPEIIKASKKAAFLWSCISFLTAFGGGMRIHPEEP